MKQLLKLLFILISSAGFAQIISVSGNITVIRNSTHITDAGFNLTSLFLSANNASLINIDVTPRSSYNRQFKPLRIFVHKVDTDWDPNLILQVKRTVLVQNLNITLGTDFQTVTNISTLFFNTVGEQFNIPIQYSLNGISVLLPAKNYTTTIVYTVLDV